MEAATARVSPRMTWPRTEWSRTTATAKTAPSNPVTSAHDRPADEPVDLVEVVAGDGDPHRSGHEEQTQHRQKECAGSATQRRDRDRDHRQSDRRDEPSKLLPFDTHAAPIAQTTRRPQARRSARPQGRAVAREAPDPDRQRVDPDRIPRHDVLDLARRQDDEDRGGRQGTEGKPGRPAPPGRREPSVRERQRYDGEDQGVPDRDERGTQQDEHVRDRVEGVPDGQGPRMRTRMARRRRRRCPRAGSLPSGRRLAAAPVAIRRSRTRQSRRGCPQRPRR